MSTLIAEVEELNNQPVLARLGELRIKTLEQLIARIMLARDREHVEQFLQVSLSGIVDKFARQIVAGVPPRRAGRGALVPAGATGQNVGRGAKILSGSGSAPGGGGGGRTNQGTFPTTPTLPAKVDLSAHFTLPVRDQGQDRLTCVAFATCGACEAVERSLSYFGPQHLYWQCKTNDIAPWDTECGTFVRTSMNALASGLCDEGDWLYNGRKLGCPDDHAPPPSGATARPFSGSWSMFAEDDLVAVKTALASNRPVVASIRFFDWWLKADYQIGDVTSPVPGDWSNEAHAVCLVGYEDLSDGSGDGNLLFRNSWGPTFGAVATGGWQDGYGRLGYRYIVGYPGGRPYSVELAELW